MISEKLSLIIIASLFINSIIIWYIKDRAYKKATEPYFVKDAIYDLGLCLIPALNIAYVLVCFYEIFLEKHFNKITLKFDKLSSLMNKRLK